MARGYPSLTAGTALPRQINTFTPDNASRLPVVRMRAHRSPPERSAEQAVGGIPGLSASASRQSGATAPPTPAGPRSCAARSTGGNPGPSPPRPCGRSSASGPYSSGTTAWPSTRLSLGEIGSRWDEVYQSSTAEAPAQAPFGRRRCGKRSLPLPPGSAEGPPAREPGRAPGEQIGKRR
jgi:hypothetical protein